MGRVPSRHCSIRPHDDHVNAPRVSVVLPVFNNERYIAEAIDSVVSQGSEDVEVIVVDDGSTDRSADIARDHGVRVLRGPHVGVSHARNVGIAAARGALIGFQDADDVWTPGSLAARVDVLERHPEFDFAFGRMCQFVDSDDPAPPWRVESVAAEAAGLLPAFLVRRAACERTGPFAENLVMAEDMDWIARLKDSGSRGVALEQMVVRHRLHAGCSTVRHAAITTATIKQAVWRSVARKRAQAR